MNHGDGQLDVADELEDEALQVTVVHLNYYHVNSCPLGLPQYEQNLYILTRTYLILIFIQLFDIHY